MSAVNSVNSASINSTHQISSKSGNDIIAIPAFCISRLWPYRNLCNAIFYLQSKVVPIFRPTAEIFAENQIQNGGRKRLISTSGSGFDQGSPRSNFIKIGRLRYCNSSIFWLSAVRHFEFCTSNFVRNTFLTIHTWPHTSVESCWHHSDYTIQYKSNQTTNVCWVWCQATSPIVTFVLKLRFCVY